MSFKVWENVLCDWVNCLNISSHSIHKILDLKDGLFFESLLKLLDPGEYNLPSFNLRKILNFLNKHYSNFNIQCNDLEVEDLSENALVKISSLLLHFCCIYDGRNCLTSPLCEKLCSKTQTHIKIFLECVTNEISNENFNNIIEQSINKVTLINDTPKFLRLHTLSSNYSSQTIDSPLQSFLQKPSPPLTLRKDREILRLQSSLNWERLEKNDCQEELKEQQEKNILLNKKLQDKSNEILKLLNKIVELENKIALHNEDYQLPETQVNSQSEINKLDQYIIKLYNEQDQLCNENDALKHKLKKTEDKLLLFQNQVISSEKEIDELLEKNQQQTIEIKNLHANCFELNALLEELQTTHSTNKHYAESDASLNGIAQEELASTVVEIQLSDALKENEELKSLLQENRKHIGNLNNQLNILNLNYKELESNYEILKSDNVILSENIEKNRLISLNEKTLLLHNISDYETLITTLKTELDILKVKDLTNTSEYTKLCNDLRCSTQHISLLDSKILDHLNQIILLNGLLLETPDHNCQTNFDDQILILNTAINKVKEELKTITENRNVLQEELNQKSKQYDDLFLERNEKLSNYAFLEEQLCKTSKKLEETTEDLKVKDDLNSQLSRDLDVMKYEIEQKNDSLKKLEMNVNQQNLQINLYENRIISLEDQCTKSEQKLTKLQNKTDDLENLKLDLENKCEKLKFNANKVLSELAIKNDELENLIVKNKQYQNKTENEIIYLQTTLCDKNTEITQLMKAKDNFLLNNNVYVNELENKIVKLNDLVESLREREKKYTEEICMTKNELDRITIKYTETYQAIEENNIENEMRISNLTENLHTVVEKYNNLDKKQILTQNRLEDVENNCIQLQNQKLEYETKNNSLILQIDVITKKKFECETELIKVQNKFKSFIKNNNELYDNFTKMCVAFALIRKDKICLYNSLKNLQDVCKELKDTLDSLKVAHVQLIDENYQNINQLQTDITHQIVILVTENINMKNTVKNLQGNLSKLYEEQNLLNLTHIEKLQNIEEVTKVLQEENFMYKQQLHDLMEDKKLFETKIYLEKEKFNEYKKTIDENIAANLIKFDNCEANLLKLKHANDVLESKRNFFQKEITTITDHVKTLEKDKLNQKINFCKEIKGKDEEINELSVKITKLEDQVSENLDKNTKLVLELNNVNESLESLMEQHSRLQQVLTHEKQEFTKKLAIEKEENKNKQNLLENLQVENKNLNLEISVVRKDLQNLKEQISICSVEHRDIENKMKTVNDQLIQQKLILQDREIVIYEVNAKLVKKIEEISDLQKTISDLQDKDDNLQLELSKIKKSRNELLEAQSKVIQETENNLIEAQKHAMDVKNDLLKRIELIEKDKFNKMQLNGDLEKQLEDVKLSKQALEIKISDITNVNDKLLNLILNFKYKIYHLDCILNEQPIEVSIQDKFSKQSINDIEYVVDNMEVILEKALKVVEQNSSNFKEMVELQKEKSLIIQEKEQLMNDYNIMRNEKIEKEQECESFKDIQVAYNILLVKYQQLEKLENKKLENDKLKQQILDLENKYASIYEIYQKLSDQSIPYTISLEKLIDEHNCLEEIVTKLRQKFTTIQTKMCYITEENNGTRLRQQVESYKSSVNDVEEQYQNFSKIIYQSMLDAVQIHTSVYNSISCGNLMEVDGLFENPNFKKDLNKFLDCSHHAKKLLEQIGTFEISLTTKFANQQKEENLHGECIEKKGELHKEIALCNLERKGKQQRQENKLMNSRMDNAVVPGRSAVVTKHESEMLKLREAYSKLMIDKSRLNLEHGKIKKLLDERTDQLNKLKFTQESYEKLLEENDKLRIEYDTIKYKRSKDQEAFKEILKKNYKTENKLQQIQKEYDEKLEIMKKKLLQMYIEEMTILENEKRFLKKENEQLTQCLKKQKSATDQLSVLNEDSKRDNFEHILGLNSTDRSTRSQSLLSTDRKTLSNKRLLEECKSTTLPKSGMSVIAENAITNSNSLQSLSNALEMEDEDQDLFNNKYLLDLKEGRCLNSTGRESTASRLLELQRRNSLYPAHLKSSYPAETQFNSPGLFKEEDLKAGVMEFDDSMSTRLIPGEKPRKKDIGTTSYKKPGPPTPSKNGGRVSIQSIDIHPRDILREHNDSKTPKRTTPSRLKALFTGRSYNLKENSEEPKTVHQSEDVSRYNETSRRRSLIAERCNQIATKMKSGKKK